MAIKLNRILCIPVALMLLLAVTMVPVMASSPFSTNQLNVNKNPLVTSANVTVTVLENTDTSQKVLVGDSLIQTTSTPDHSYAVTTITNEKTKKVEHTYKFKVSKSSSGYTTEVTDNGKSIGSFQTSVDPLKPNVLNSNNAAATGVTSGLNTISPALIGPVGTMQGDDKYWDQVWYQKNGVPYAHPNYYRYITDIYKSNIIWGYQLVAVQIDHKSSGALVILPVATLAASLSVLLPNLGIAAFGGLVGAGSMIAAFLGTTGLLDERGNIWVWGSYQQSGIIWWFVNLTVPSYFKIATYGWDFMGKGSP